MRVPIVDLVGHPGQSRQLVCSITPAQLVPGDEDELRWDPPGATIADVVAVDAMLESVVEGILVRGTADVDLVMACSRCLIEIVDESTLAVTELYLDPDRGDAQHDEADDYLLDPDRCHLDLAPALRDAITLVVPMQPLCRDDCAGLCAVCGGDLNDSDCGHRQQHTADPRWARLAEVDVSDN